MEDFRRVMSWLEGLADPDWREFNSDSEVSQTAIAAIELLKEQDRLLKSKQKRINEMQKEKVRSKTEYHL